MNLLLNLRRVLGTTEEKMSEPVLKPGTDCHGFEDTDEGPDFDKETSFSPQTTQEEEESSASPWIAFARRNGFEGSDEDWLAIQHAYDQCTD
eukprot:CAMPEP_0181461426 /NCGR_PEP_ID=MMETSP1110-20121109/33873_1 /TAXON_ID=174948 /ORGANISM="Symbiodinium sp., Strain CCMP421" /LENGTH=91 /DNA_ID=CAMNT_0023586053 /DNA_START=58 /DNA_END=333 /DNA_ORIENTATION=+